MTPDLNHGQLAFAQVAAIDSFHTERIVLVMERQHALVHVTQRVSNSNVSVSACACEAQHYR